VLIAALAGKIYQEQDGGDECGPQYRFFTLKELFKLLVQQHF